MANKVELSSQHNPNKSGSCALLPAPVSKAVVRAMQRLQQQHNQQTPLPNKSKLPSSNNPNNNQKRPAIAEPVNRTVLRIMERLAVSLANNNSNTTR